MVSRPRNPIPLELELDELSAMSAPHLLFEGVWGFKSGPPKGSSAPSAVIITSVQHPVETGVICVFGVVTQATEPLYTARAGYLTCHFTPEKNVLVLWSRFDWLPVHVSLLFVGLGGGENVGAQPVRRDAAVRAHGLAMNCRDLFAGAPVGNRLQGQAGQVSGRFRTPETIDDAVNVDGFLAHGNTT